MKARGNAGGWRDAAAGWLFLAPFLATYCLFLVYPFAKGIWISLFDWDLLAVSLNPDAKRFVGFDNYVRMLWGSDMVWGVATRPLLQGVGLLVAFAALLAVGLRRMGARTGATLAVLGFLVFAAGGWTPGEEGRWFDRRFWPVVGNTVTFVLLTVPAITAVALVLAAALNRETRAMSVLRTVFFLSQVLSVTVVTLIWQIMFSPQQGMIANIAASLGMTPVAWLTEPGYATAAIVIATLWWSLGIAMILFLAGLQDISKEIYEAATLDGSGPFATFFQITLPNLRRTVTLVVVLQIILHFQVFGQVHLMTNGGPNDQTQVLVRHIYQTAFRDSALGRGSAMAVFLFLIMAVFSAMQFFLNRETDR